MNLISNVPVKINCDDRLIASYRIASPFLFTLVPLWLLLSFQASAQISLVINRIPENTPKNASIYVSGNFNEWNPREEKYQFKKRADGKYQITLPASRHTLEYKFTRGAWESVEGDINGKKIANRVSAAEDQNSTTIYTEIKSWEDLPLKRHCTILVTHIPENTPHDASLYIAGSFNNWKENDPDFQLIKGEAGTYSITLPNEIDTLTYKFTRGTWSSVECRRNGHVLHNRLLIRKKQEATVAKAQIEAWEDIGTGSTPGFLLALWLSIGQASLLILALLTLQERNKDTTRPLLVILLVLALTLFGRTISYSQDLVTWQPRLLLLSDLAYFLYAPLFYLHIRKLLGAPVPAFMRVGWWLLPFGLQVAVYFPLLVLPSEELISRINDQQYVRLFAGSGAIALLHSLFYWFRSLHFVTERASQKTGSRHQNDCLRYCQMLLTHGAICLFTWIVAYVAYAVALALHTDPIWVSEASLDALWLVIAAGIGVHSYVAFNRPELFRNPVEEVTETQKAGTVLSPKESLDGPKEALERLMRKNKPYLNPRLTLQELAERMNINIHSLSRLINEGYTKNFFDFINEYRIEEFKRLVNDEHYRNHTFLAIALEVGFSSKTTFNRAFKKSTGKTPREYFHFVQESQLEKIDD